MNWRPIWNGERVCATNGIQRRRDKERRTNEVTCASREPRPQSNCRRSNGQHQKPDMRHLPTRMMPTFIRWTQLARVTHKKRDGTHLYGNPLRTLNIRHRRNKRCSTIPQMPHKRHAHNNRSGQPTRTSRAISYHWRNTTLLPLKDARCTRHIAHTTYDTCDKQKRLRQHFVDDEHSSLHTCA